MLFIDANGLKLIYVSFGHEVGDQLLKKMPGLYKECVEPMIALLALVEISLLSCYLKPTKNMPTNFQHVLRRTTYEEVESLLLSVASGLATKKNIQEWMIDVFKKAEDNMYREKISERSNLRH